MRGLGTTDILRALFEDGDNADVASLFSHKRVKEVCAGVGCVVAPVLAYAIMVR